MQPVVLRPPFVKIIVPISELWSSQCMVLRPAFPYQCKSTNPQNLRCLVENLWLLLFPGFRTTKNSRQPTLLPLQKTSGCSQKNYETQTRGFPAIFIFFISRMLVCCLAGSGVVVVVGATTERFHRFQPLLTFFTDTQAQAGQKVGLSFILLLSLGLLFRKESFPKSECYKHCDLFSSLASGSGIAESFWRSQTKECSSLCSGLVFYMQTLGMTFFSFLIVLWILLTVWCSSSCYLWW